MATNTVSLNVQSNLSAQVTGGPIYPPLSTPTQLYPNDSSYPFGTSTGNVDSLSMPLIAATVGGVSIQLNGGSLVDPFGGTFAPARITSLGFVSAGTATVNITGTFITGAFGASASIPLHASGRAVFDFPTATGLAVPSGTNSVITFTAASGTQSVRVLLAGRSV